MGLDVRLPIGLMFSLIGFLMGAYGAFNGSAPEMTQHSLGINIDLWWGAFLLVFGLVMLGAAIVAGRKNPPPSGK
jgi:hypothetical protein